MRPVIAASPRLPIPVRTARLKLPQGQIFWREVGQGQPVIFLHDAWQDGADWQAWLARLGPNDQGLAPDLLGFGDSDLAIAPASIALEVEALVAWMDALHLPPARLIGQGLGGWIAVTLAAQHPDRVQGLVLLTPEGLQPQTLAGRWRSAQWLVGRGSLWAGLLQVARPVGRLLGLGAAIQRQLVYRQQLRRSPTACRLLFQRRRAEIQAELVDAVLGQLAQPVWLIQGAEDAPLQRSLTAAYATALPQAQCTTVPGSSQPLALLESATFMAQFEDWLQAR